MRLLYVIQRFNGFEWLIQHVKEGSPDDFEVKRMAISAYIEAIEWDINTPVRMLVITRDADNNTVGEVVTSQHNVHQSL